MARKFRQRIIEAVQWTEENKSLEELALFVGVSARLFHSDGNGALVIPHFTGDLHVKCYDWVIKKDFGTGEFSVCPDVVFRFEYEPV